MINKAKPEIKITLDKERTLRLDGNAMTLFEAQTGKNLLRANTYNELNMTEIQILLWCCLKDEDMELKKDQLGKMYDMRDMPYIVEIMKQLWDVSMPDKDEGTDPLATLQNG